MKVVAFVPIKMNNERTPGKNTKLFYDGTPLIHFILAALKEAKQVDEIYVYCSKEEIKNYLIDGVKYLKRDEKFDTPQASINDMFYTFSQEVPADIYVVAHATSPFTLPETIDKGIEMVKTGNYDSALAVEKMQEFFWLNGKPMNYDYNHIPRTQDLDPIYMETTGLYIFNNNVVTKLHRRIGDRPYLIEVSKIETTDINNPIDFEIANAIYKNILSK